MPGTRYYNFREGDRSEYLANFLLSGLGLVVPVPRQEDIGIDFYCNIADQEAGNLTFGFPYLIQAKSSSENTIRFGGINNGKWLKHEVTWLFSQELPLLFGFVDKREISIKIHSGSTLWYLLPNFPNHSSIVFKRRNDPNERGGMPQPSAIVINDYPNELEGDRHEYTVDLGHPIVDLQYSDFENAEKIKRIKFILRTIIFMELRNITYRRMNLPYFEWLINSITNESIELGWAYLGTDGDISPFILETANPILISLALNFKHTGNIQSLTKLKSVIELLPQEKIPNEIKHALPEIFS